MNAKPMRPDLARNLAERRQWDWTLQNCELAQIHGLDRERIRQIRKQVGAPQFPSGWHRHRVSGSRALAKLGYQFPAGVPARAADVSRALGVVGIKRSRVLMKEAGIPVIDARFSPRPRDSRRAGATGPAVG